MMNQSIKTRLVGFILMTLFTVFSIGMNASAQSVVINEIFYNTPDTVGSEYEFIELYNNGSSSVDLSGYYFSDGFVYTFTTGTMLPADSYIVIAESSAVYADLSAPVFQMVDGGLSGGGELIQLSDSSGNIVDEVEYDDKGLWPIEADGTGPSLVLSDPDSDNSLASSWLISTEDGGSPGVVNMTSEIVPTPTVPPTSDIVITELFYNPPSGLDAYEFVELYNASSSAVDVSGYSFSNGFEFVFPQGTVIDAGEYVVIASDPAVYASLSADVYGMTSGGLSNSGERISLANANGDVIDEVKYDDDGTIWPASPDGDGYSLQLTSTSSENASSINWIASPQYGGSAGVANSSSAVSIVPTITPVPPTPTPNASSNTAVVINEIYYNPPVAENPTAEFIELYNTSDSAVDLSGYAISRGVSYTFTQGTTLAANGYLVLAGDAAEYSNLSVFVDTFTSGTLSNGGEMIELVDDAGLVVDQVLYDDTEDWSLDADGLGRSLELTDSSKDNFEAQYWGASSIELGSPGVSNSSQLTGIGLSTESTSRNPLMYGGIGVLLIGVIGMTVLRKPKKG